MSDGVLGALHTVIASSGTVEREAKSVSLIISSDLQRERPVELGSLCPFQVNATVPTNAPATIMSLGLFRTLLFRRPIQRVP